MSNDAQTTSPFRTWLEQIVLIALLISAIASIALISTRLYQTYGGSSASAMGTSLESGAFFFKPDVRLKANARELVFVYSSHCEFCKRSTPVYSKVIAQVKERNPGVQVSVVAVDSPQTALGELREQGFEGDRVLDRRSLALPVNAVPVAAILDEEGRILYSHVGLLTDTQAKQMAEIL